MFWADKTAEKIINSKNHTPFWVDDMFTPSGYAHIGSIRGPLVHDMIYRALKDQKQKVTFSYIFNDFDPIDGLPAELEKFSPFLGVPLRLAPSPDPNFESFAEFFSHDFKNVLQTLGFGATFFSSWDMYHEGKFNDVIKTALNHADVIGDIYQRVSGSKKREKGWLPLQVICEKCSKLGTTRVHDWDGKTVAYTCERAMVKWAAGCGYTGRISPYDGKGKLPWKVDWPAHWKVLGVTIEGAGKDHSSAGGSRDIARELCKEVFHIPDPFNIPYEFFLIGGKKMSSSKGLGLKGRDLTNLLPAEIARFLFIRTNYAQAIEFDPMGTMAIADLFDEYDRSWGAYNENGEALLSRAFELAQIKNIPKKEKLFLPRFRDIANFSQLPNVNLAARFAEIKGSALTKKEESILAERLTFAKIWIDGYAPDEYRYQLSTATLSEINLSQQQWDFLNQLSMVWSVAKDPEHLQSELFKLAKKINIPLKDAFQALYTVLLGKSHGPRAGWLLKKFPVDAVTSRLMLNKNGDTQATKKENVTRINKPDFFVLDSTLINKYPSISVGIALIKNVSIAKTNPQLEKEKAAVLQSLGGLTTETLGTYPEILSYRKLYKEIGIDWHSRRPSPEALLRRVALGKGLYSINTCVDAYNLVVMKHRVSVGAFDADCVAFPTVLRFAREGEDILLLGDSEVTKYTPAEIAYFDETGGYNMDFNYRDAQRTKVTETTKNLWINVDGVFDISSEHVAKSLRETVAIIQKYCGGEVAFEGVVG